MSAPATTRIRQAALDLMAKKGIAATTTQDIARRARCSQAAIYKQWEGKEILAREVFDEAYTRFLADLDSAAAGGRDPAERTVGVLLAVLRFARSDPSAFAFLFHVFHSEYAGWLVPHVRRPRDVLLREVEAGQRAGAFSGGRPATRTALLLGMAIRLAFLERQNLVDGTPEEVEESLVDAALAVLEG
jgi:AcrR family transcriptional regulator